MSPESAQWGSLRPAFAAQLGAAAAAFNVDLRWESHGWVALLNTQSRVAAVVGYTFPLNNAAAAELANDKVAAFQRLLGAGIPAIEHKLVRFDRASGDEKRLRTQQIFLQDLPCAPVVIKPLAGHGGTDVRRAWVAHDVERLLAEMAQRYRAVSVSPWVKIDTEIRLVLLDGVVLLAFRKEHQANAGTREWRHNLRLGAIPVIVEIAELPAVLTSSARAAVATMGLRFAAVDVVSTGGDWRILEVNSGVCLEHFSLTSRRHYLLAEDVYASAIAAIFDA